MPGNYHCWVVIDAALNQLEIVYHELDTIVELDRNGASALQLTASAIKDINRLELQWRIQGGGGVWGVATPPKVSGPLTAESRYLEK